MQWILEHNFPAEVINDATGEVRRADGWGYEGKFATYDDAEGYLLDNDRKDDSVHDRITPEV